jgi:hypothetical protein
VRTSPRGCRYKIKFDFPLPEDHRAIILSTVSATTANLAEAPPRSPAPVSTEGRSWVGGFSDAQTEQGRIVLPPETGEQPSLLLEYLSDAPWLDRKRPGSLDSIIDYE